MGPVGPLDRESTRLQRASRLRIEVGPRGQSPLAEDDGEAFCAIGEAAAMLLQSLRWFMPFGGSGPLAEQRDLGDDCASEVSGDSEAGAASHFRSGMMTAFTLPAGDSFVH